MPPEIACYAVRGPAATLEALLAGLDAETLARHRDGAQLSALIATAAMDAAVEAAREAGLDITAVGGYAAPLGIDA